MAQDGGGGPLSVVVPEDVTREAMGFMQRVLGPVAEIGEFCSDKVRFYRWKSAVRTIEKANEIAQDRNIKPQQVPIKFLVPFLEHCSLEDENSELTEEWAKLLVSASVEFKEKHLIYSGILSRLGPTEAKVLKHFWSKVDKKFFQTLASAFQAYGFDYALLTGTKRLRAPSGGPSLNVIAEKDAQRRGCFFIFMQGGPSLKESHETRLPFSDPMYWRLPTKDNKGAYDHTAHFIVLDKERLISLKAYTEEDEGKHIALLWAELTPLGFDFVETIEGGGI